MGIEDTSSSRLSVTILRSYGSLATLRELLYSRRGFEKRTANQAEFDFESRVDDRSSRARRSSRWVDGEEIFTYRVTVFHTERRLLYFLATPDLIWDFVDSVRGQSRDVRFYPLNLALDRLVAKHRGCVTRLVARLQNRPGLSSMMVFGDSILNSPLYKDYLSTSTITGAELECPFGMAGWSLYVRRSGSFTMEQRARTSAVPPFGWDAEQGPDQLPQSEDSVPDELDRLTEGVFEGAPAPEGASPWPLSRELADSDIEELVRKLYLEYSV